MPIQSVEPFDIVKTFLQFAHLGAAWVMWLMVLLAAVLAIVILERLRLYQATTVNAPAMGRRLMDYLESGSIEDAMQLTAKGSAMEERVLSDGLRAFHRGHVATEQIMRSSLQREKQRFERYLGYMGTVGSNAPFIGLFGTVIGIVISFEDLAANPKGGMAVVGPGIAEALVSTAVGLLVAIPAVIAFNNFHSALTRRIGNVEFLTGILLSQVRREGS